MGGISSHMVCGLFLSGLLLLKVKGVICVPLYQMKLQNNEVSGIISSVLLVKEILSRPNRTPLANRLFRMHNQRKKSLCNVAFAYYIGMGESIKKHSSIHFIISSRC